MQAKVLSPMPSGTSVALPFDPGSSLAKGLHVMAALGGGAPHRFLVDTGSVGVLVPRCVLGPDYQSFDPAQDIEFGYVSSGKTYWGQWVAVPVVLGVPADWDGTGDYLTATVEVFAVDEPSDFAGGLIGIGFAIGGLADGGPARNPLLNLRYRDACLPASYSVTAQGIAAGMSAAEYAGFATVALSRDADDVDWQQPIGRLGLPGDFTVDLPVLIDTGVSEMLLFLAAESRPPSLTQSTTFPAGVAVRITLPAPDAGGAAALDYAFRTGDAAETMAPSSVKWRNGRGINTGRNVLAGADYLFDGAAGRVGFRVPPAERCPNLP